MTEEAVGVLEHRLAQRHEAGDEPVEDVRLLGVDVDREVEVVADELGRRAAHLQHVEALEDEDVGLADDRLLTGQHVVDHVAVHRGTDLGGAALDVAQERQQPARVVALGEALARHQPALLEHGVGMEEAVGGDEVDVGMVRPP